MAWNNHALSKSSDAGRSSEADSIRRDGNTGSPFRHLRLVDDDDETTSAVDDAHRALRLLSALREAKSTETLLALRERLIDLGTPAAEPVLAELQRRTLPAAVRVELLKALEWLGPVRDDLARRLCDVANSSLEDTDHDVREAAAWALRAAPRSEAARVASERLPAEDDDDVREALEELTGR